MVGKAGLQLPLSVGACGVGGLETAKRMARNIL